MDDIGYLFDSPLADYSSDKLRDAHATARRWLLQEQTLLDATWQSLYQADDWLERVITKQEKIDKDRANWMACVLHMLATQSRYTRIQQEIEEELASRGESI